MPDNKIHIRVELAKDNSGKLSLMAYFSEKAPNVAKDSEGYYWIPTTEEKDFLNDAFGLMPGMEIKHLSGENIEKQIEEPESIIEEKPEPPIVEKPETITENNEDAHIIEEKPEEIISAPPEKQENKPDDIPNFEKNSEDPIFEVTQKDTEVKDTSGEEKPDEEEILVKADEAAIEAALKKKEEKDKSLVEADEQTIIDRVLSQKKKGKWSRK